MPRSEARLQFDIWEGLEGLSADARLVYCVALTDRSVNHAGQGFIRIDRWERAAALPGERIEKAMVELEREPHVAFDRTTGEFLIRTMIRRDGYAEQPYLLKGALAAARNIESKHLRRVLAKELRKLPPRKPDGVSKSGNAIVYPDPHACADEIDPGAPGPQGPHGLPSEEGPETLFGDSPDPVETHLSVAPNPVSPSASQKGVEREGGGGTGGGGGSTPVTTSAEIKEAATRVSARDQRIANVHAAQLVVATLPRTLGNYTTREALQTRIGERILIDEDGALTDHAITSALTRWVNTSKVAPAAIEWMLDDAIKESLGGSAYGSPGAVSLTDYKAAKESSTDRRVSENADRLAEMFGPSSQSQLPRGTA